MALRIDRPVTRRRFLFGLGAAGFTVAGGGAYMRFGEARWLEISRTEVPLSRGRGDANPIRVAHLSDLHLSPVVSLSYIAEAVKLVVAQRPDLIAVTGDFFTNRLRDAARYATVLRLLSDTAPTFACLGNHDGGPWTLSAGGNATIDEALALLRAGNLTCLHNDSRTVTVRQRTVQIFGVGDLWSRMCDPATAFDRAGPRQGSATRLLLNHNPDAKELLQPFDWDLMLCGHTHGGQLRLPLLGTPFAPVQDKRFVEGLHRWNDRWLYVTRGVGNLHGLRFNCRPEVSVLEIL